MPWMNGMWGMGWMWFFPFLFLAGLGVFLMVFMRRMGGDFCGTASSPRNKDETPKEVLDQRYAKGEITREQYLEMRKDLD